MKPLIRKLGTIDCDLVETTPIVFTGKHHSPWLVLVDLDADADCVPPACTEWLPEPAPQMCFRVVVREVETWLLADRQHLARFWGVSAARLPRSLEELDDPKGTVVTLARQSRHRAIREDMVPRPGSGKAVGPAYASRLIEFAKTSWRPDVAEARSDSLRRCRERPNDLVQGNG